MQLIALDTAETLGDVNLPGYRLHLLMGNAAGRWAIAVDGNWRLTFEFEDGNVFDLNYEDYH